MNESFTLQPELAYSNQGISEFENTGDPVDLHYINLPVIFQYKLNGLKGFSLEAGPQLGFLVDSTSISDRQIDEPNSFDLGLALGTAYQVNENLDINLVLVLTYYRTYK